MTLISIIIPCYNSEKFIGETIDSVCSQTYGDWEMVVVDDGSTDRSVWIVQNYVARDQRIKLIRQPNGGVAKARNVGFSETSLHSSYLIFLDADDCLMPHMLSIMIGYLENNLEVGLVHCGLTHVDENSRTLETPNASRYAPTFLGLRELLDSERETPFPSIFSLALIIPSLSLIRRAVYLQTPQWDEGFGQPCEDTDLFLQIALLSKVHYIPEKLVYYRRHSTQSTANHDQFSKQEKRLYNKWLNMEGLTQEQEKIVAAAWRFREGRLNPHIGIQSASNHFQQGRILLALRFYLGAIRLYLTSWAK
jgi:glycosyltransferase involved in cell wall biosynthesis